MEILKDRITIVPYVIETSAGGFKWTLSLDGPHVVIPSRYPEGAVEEFIAIPALQTLAADPRYSFWKSTALGTIKWIERQNRRKKR